MVLHHTQTAIPFRQGFLAADGLVKSGGPVPSPLAGPQISAGTFSYRPPQVKDFDGAPTGR